MTTRSHPYWFPEKPKGCPHCDVQTDKTLIAVVLDESGSMGIKRDEVIQGYNDFIRTQLEAPGEARLSLTRFNTSVGIPSGPTKLVTVPKLSRETYIPGGWTALYDAVGRTIHQAQHTQLSGEKVVVVVITDGQENHSTEFSLKRLSQQIQDAQDKGWAFLYIGPDPDQWAQRTGTFYANTVAYLDHDPQQSWAMASNATVSYRASGDNQNTGLRDSLPQTS
jgi:hypothetical protein